MYPHMKPVHKLQRFETMSTTPVIVNNKLNPRKKEAIIKKALPKFFGVALIDSRAKTHHKFQILHQMHLR
jgi:hypothetical protein